MTITHRITKIYPRDKVKYVYSRVNLKELTKGELYRFYYDIYDIYPESEELAIKRLTLMLYEDSSEFEAYQRYREIIKNEETEAEIKDIEDETEKFYRFYATWEDDYNVVEITKYMNTFTNISEEEVRSRYFKPREGKEKYDFINKISDVVSILDIQRGLFIKEMSECFLWRIVVLHNNIPYGSIIVFYRPDLRNDKNEPYVIMEEITKYPIPMLASMLFPEYKEMPKLNAVLLPLIENLARSLNVNLIYVWPLPHQAKQLVQHYGFIETDYEWALPCERSPSTLFPNRYMKYITKTSKTLKTSFVDNALYIYLTLNPIKL